MLMRISGSPHSLRLQHKQLWRVMHAGAAEAAPQGCASEEMQAHIEPVPLKAHSKTSETHACEGLGLISLHPCHPPLTVCPVQPLIHQVNKHID